MRSLLRAPSSRFLLASSFLITACVLLLRTRAFAMNPDVAAWGMTLDLAISIPLFYWFFIVRPGKASAITLDPAGHALVRRRAVVLDRVDRRVRSGKEWKRRDVMRLAR